MKFVSFHDEKDYFDFIRNGGIVRSIINNELYNVFTENDGEVLCNAIEFDDNNNSVCDDEYYKFDDLVEEWQVAEVVKNSFGIR